MNNICPIREAYMQSNGPMRIGLDNLHDPQIDDITSLTYFNLKIFEKALQGPVDKFLENSFCDSCEHRYVCNKGFSIGGSNEKPVVIITQGFPN